MGMFDRIKIEEAYSAPYMNTGTLFDIVSGAFVPGVDGSMIANGGLTYTNGFIGRPQTYKSTDSLSLMISAASLYEGSSVLVYDSEMSQKLQRLLRFKHEDAPDIPLTNFKLTDATKMSAEELYTLILSICKDKEDHRKEYEVETPFLDTRTGLPIRMLIPTFCAIDSLSKMQSGAMEELLSSTSLTSSKQNTMYMSDGMLKTKFISQLPRLGAKYNIIFVITAHVGDKFDLNPMVKSPKELQHMKATDKIKYVGADFDFLMSNLLEVRKAELLQTDKRECLYPNEEGSDFDLNQLTSVLVRCKNNASGTAKLTSIVSQAAGLQSSLSNYHFLKEHGYYGLLGSDRTHSPALHPSVNLQRTTVRDKLKDYKTKRAVELIAQYCYIQKYWAKVGLGRDFSMPVEKFSEMLIANQTYAIDDILESRGYWTYNKKDPRKYLSIYDAVGLVDGSFKSDKIVVKKTK